MVCAPTPLKRLSSSREWLTRPSSFEAPVREPEERADPHVVDAGFHGPMVAVQPPAEIAFDRPRWMNAGVHSAIVGFLEHLEGAHPHLAQPPELFDAHGGGIHVHPADIGLALAGLDLDGIDGVYGAYHVIDVAVGMLAEDHDEALVAEVARQGLGLPAYLVQSQAAPLHLSVLGSEAAVNAGIHALAAEIERREDDYAVVIDLSLDGQRRVDHLPPGFGRANAHEGADFLEIESLDRRRLGEDVPHFRYGRLSASIRDYPVDSLVVDEILAALEEAVDLVAYDDVSGPILRRDASLGHQGRDRPFQNDRLRTMCDAHASLRFERTHRGAGASKAVADPWPSRLR